MCTRLTFHAPVVLLAGTLLVTGCRKDPVENLTTLPARSSSVFIIPANVPAGQSFSFATPDAPNTAQPQSALIRRAQLSEVKLTIESPAGQTFQLLRSLRFFLAADNLPEVEVANQLNISPNADNTLLLNVTGAELRAYFRLPTFRLRTEVVTNVSNPEPVRVRADLTFNIRILL